MSLWSKIKKTVITKDVDDKKKSNINVGQKKEEKKEEKQVAKTVGKTQEFSSKKKKEEKIVIKSNTGDSYKILMYPVITEKAMFFQTQGKYIFKVSKNSNKIMIKKAIKSLYGVMPQKVSIINMPGKQVRFRWKKGVRSSWKKAIVTLKKGEKIDLTI